MFDTPTADVLPRCALAISADVTYPLVQTPQNANYLEADANVRFSPVKGLDIGLTGYTFTDYVLDLKYQILGNGNPAKFGLAVGCYDIGLSEYISPIGDGLDAEPVDFPALDLHEDLVRIVQQPAHRVYGWSGDRPCTRAKRYCTAVGCCAG